MIHIKNQALFFSKDKSKRLNCHLLQFLFGTLRDKKRGKNENGTFSYSFSYPLYIDIWHAAMTVNTLNRLTDYYRLLDQLLSQFISWIMP